LCPEVFSPTMNCPIIRASCANSASCRLYPPHPAIPDGADELKNDETVSAGANQPGVDTFELLDLQATSAADPFGAFGHSMQVSSVSDPFFTSHGPVKPAS
jgi:hypothetical protein